MKLIVFGATGSLGRCVTEQALESGHRVTAFARNPSKLELSHSNLRLESGDVLDNSTVASVIVDHDAVVITLGAGMSGGVRAAGTKHVIEGMQQHGIRRLVCLSTLGAGDSYDHLNFFWKRIMFGLLLGKALADHEEQEALVRSSNLDWVVVRPAAFADGPRTGNYRHGSFQSERNLKLKVSRADVAEFMLKGLTSNSYLHQAPGLSY